VIIDNKYNLVYLGLAIYAIANPFVYIWLLLDLVQRSEDL